MPKILPLIFKMNTAIKYGSRHMEQPVLFAVVHLSYAMENTAVFEVVLPIQNVSLQKKNTN